MNDIHKTISTSDGTTVHLDTYHTDAGEPYTVVAVVSGEATKVLVDDVDTFDNVETDGFV